MSLSFENKEIIPVSKAASFSTQQTGTALWTPASGKKVAVSNLNVSISGVTTGRVTIWFGDPGDTTYTEGTDVCLFDGDFAPTAAIPVFIAIPFDYDILCRKDCILRLTTSAAITCRIQVFGYEAK